MSYLYAFIFSLKNCQWRLMQFLEHLKACDNKDLLTWGNNMTWSQKCVLLHI